MPACSDSHRGRERGRDREGAVCTVGVMSQSIHISNKYALCVCKKLQNKRAALRTDDRRNQPYVVRHCRKHGQEAEGQGHAA